MQNIAIHIITSGFSVTSILVLNIKKHFFVFYFQLEKLA